MKKYLIIKADTNDADYVISENKITDEQLMVLQPMFEAIKNFKPYKYKTRTFTHNYPTQECCRDELGEKSPEQIYLKSGLVTKKAFNLFDNIIPVSQYGIHSIVSIRLVEIVSDKELL